ncbi:MAG TPA: flagellar hook-associated protein FlgK [Gemmatimonadaceae bacterium]|nr:flagellar hook-associated protein FlgK [Gemmatimonadaceae bacterium]
MSIGSILNMARTGMNAQQTAIQIASQNISNADSTGYSRQRVEMATSLPTIFPYGTIGTGVYIKTVSRARDSLLDITYRSDASAQSQAETTSTGLDGIQSILNEPSDNGLSSALDSFYSSWNDLATDPTNGSAKEVVRQNGINVATTMNNMAARLDTLASQTRDGMTTDVAQVNSLSQQIANYNNEIVAAESNGNAANDLRDARDNLVDQMSTLVGGQVVEHASGSVAIYVNGRSLVDGPTVNQLQVGTGTVPTITFANAPTLPMTGLGGSLGARVDLVTNRIPATMNQLDSMAKGLVQTVNSIHSSGQVFTGNPPVGAPAGNFFEMAAVPPAGGDPALTARGISIASTLTDGSLVAASGGTATGPGNNDVAAQISALRDTPVSFTDANGNPLGSVSVQTFFQQIVGDVATSAKQAQDDSTVQQTLASNAQAQRQSVSGVVTDEELISVIQHQHAYQAAARLVSVVDDMTQTLVDLGR